jgi:hypothetical protein
MRRVWTKYGLLPLVLLIAASFLFIGRGVPQVDASAFAPTLTAALSSNAAGAVSDINESAQFGTSPVVGTRSFPAQSVYFTPAGFGIPDCSPTAACPYALDDQTGTFTSVTTFGVGNSQCAVPLTVTFPNGMRNASTDATDSITAGTGFANLVADVNPPNGIKDGIEHWNDLLNNLIAAGLLPATPPRERQTLDVVITATGTQVWVDVLTYDPGLVGGPATGPLGYATTFVLQNANPTVTSVPSLITDTCGLFNAFNQFGTSAGGVTHRTNPGPGTNLFFFQAGSQRDADQGPSAPLEPTLFPLPGGLSGFGQFNAIDTCPFQPNHGSVLAPAGAPFNGDLGEGAGDGIDSVCDPAPAVNNGPDIDADAYFNRGDNCPQVPNGVAGPNQTNQSDVSEVVGPPAANEVGQQPVDGGPASDSIGDDCDLNLQVPDGHFHTALLTAPTCVIGGPFADGDGDGWCDIEELGIGGSTNGTPEALAVPGTCSDGADNDLDGNADLNDSGCQLPAHDLSIKKVNGATLTCNPSNTNGYNMNLNNSQAVSENGEISIYLDSQPPFVPPAGPAPAAGKSAGSVSNVSGATVTQSGPINIDGDVDVEWLTKATVVVNNAPSSTTVHFNVTYPACGGGPNVTPVDYTIAIDLCHANDVAPLGVGPLNGACAGGAADGGQDANTGNDGVVTRSVDDISK